MPDYLFSLFEQTVNKIPEKDLGCHGEKMVYDQELEETPVHRSMALKRQAREVHNFSDSRTVDL